ILILMFAMAVMVKLSIGIENIHHYLVPLCIFPIIIRTFFDTKTAILLHVINVFMISFVVPDPFEFTFLQIFAGILLQFGINNLHRRSQFFASAVVVFLSYAVTYLGINIVQEGTVTRLHRGMFLWFGGNTVLTLLAYPLIYLLEKAFGLLSEMRLLEMADTNNTLLRQLNERAPGTFQHTLQVANLAEEAVRVVKGNVLLTRVGALYHDIGKMKNPQYFIENQSGMNPHDDLQPEESATIIIDHVIHGLELARKAGLHEDILDFIRTHHGTSKVGYFFKRAKEENPDVDPQIYTYPGPTPFSKETAILMMADGVEAASRSLPDYNEESIGNLINGIIDHHLNSGQFDRANITLAEIQQVKKVFKNKLLNIYHNRIAY
ncbi:MAG: HDIG domain-containing protein, partial [Flavobacteriales bacterium]|nr:HDIG domain-containing protein [Flavobacteriales bacterium]